MEAMTRSSCSAAAQASGQTYDGCGTDQRTGQPPANRNIQLQLAGYCAERPYMVHPASHHSRETPEYLLRACAPARIRALTRSRCCMAPVAVVYAPGMRQERKTDRESPMSLSGLALLAELDEKELLNQFASIRREISVMARQKACKHKYIKQKDPPERFFRWNRL